MTDDGDKSADDAACIEANPLCRDTGLRRLKLPSRHANADGEQSDSECRSEEEEGIVEQCQVPTSRGVGEEEDYPDTQQAL